MSKVASYEFSGTQYWVHNGGQAWSLSAPGSDTLRFEVRSGDQWWKDPDWKERSEICGDQVLDAGQTISVRYGCMIEPGAANTADWIVLGQFHADDSHTSPPFALELVGEKMAVVLRYQLPGQSSQTTVYAWIDDRNIERGRYYDIDIKVNFDVTGKGFLEVWRDGSQIVDYDGPIGYGYGVYWKHGVYREESKETIAVNYKDFALAVDDGVVIVGTAAADRIDPRSSPDGQPTVTSRDDLIRGAGGSDKAMAGGGDDILVMGRGNDRATGGEGNDVLKGARGNDRLDGGFGNDVLKGSKGKDMFVFAAGYGDDVIRDLRVGQDRIAFDDALFAGRSGVLAAATPMANGVMVTAGEDSLFLAGITMSQLKAADFLFV